MATLTRLQENIKIIKEQADEIELKLNHPKIYLVCRVVEPAPAGVFILSAFLDYGSAVLEQSRLEKVAGNKSYYIILDLDISRN